MYLYFHCRVGVFVVFMVLCEAGWGVAPSKQQVPGEILVKVESPEIKILKSGDSVQILPSTLKTTCAGMGMLRSDSLSVDSLMSVTKSTKGTDDTSLTPSATRNLFLLKFKKEAPVSDLAKEISNMPGVLYAEPNYTGSLCEDPVDMYYLTNQQPLYAPLGLEQAWDFSTGSSSVTIAVLDSGIDTIHPEFVDRLVEGYNFLTKTTDTQDPLGHGTRVAGIIGARGNDSGSDSGMAGICWDCRLMPLVVAGTDQLVTAATAAMAIEYAWRNGADVINMSFAIGLDSQTLEAACTIASNFAVLAAAAGNQGQNLVPLYPAAYDPVLSVAAISSATERAPFSNYNLPGVNEFIDLAAPGVGVYTTIPGGMYDGLRTVGTSFACPIVAGVAGLLRAHYPAQSPSAIVDHIQRHATPIGTFVTSGRINAGAALSAPLVPNLYITNISIADGTGLNSSNDADGALDGAEDAEITLCISNNGGDMTSSTLDLTLISNDSNITVITGTAILTPLAHGQTIRNTTAPFTLHVQTGAPQTNASMTLRIAGLPEVIFTTVIEDEVTIPQNISSNLTLTADQTWIATGEITVLSGATLTIMPGTSLKFEEGAQMKVLGSLSSIGTQENFIRWITKAPPPESLFAPSREYPVGGYPNQVRLADMNGDGSLDILTLNSANNNISLLVGDGEGGFLPQVPLTVGAGPKDFALADITQDGLLDIVVADQSDEYGDSSLPMINVIPGQTGNNFGSPIPYPVSVRDDDRLLCVDVGDFNGDSRPDVIATVWPTYESSEAIVFFTSASGDLGSGVSYNVGNNPTDLAIGDVTGDGKPDIVTVDYNDSAITILEGDGTGGLISSKSYAVGGGSAISIGDVSNDGFPDIITSYITTPGGFSVLISDGIGGFLPYQNNIRENPISDFLPCDINSDGLIELVAINGNFLSINSNTTLGNLDLEVRYGIKGLGPTGIACGDLNGDTRPDVVTVNYETHDVSVIIGSPTGRFQDPEPLNTNGVSGRVQVGDVSGDGIPDVVASNVNDVSILKGDGNGSFLQPEKYSIQPYPYGIALGDLNGDHVEDIATPSLYTNRVSVLLANPSGGFLPESTYIVGPNPYGIAMGDLSGDTVPDLVTANFNGGSITLLTNNGSGVFNTPQDFSVGGGQPKDVAIGDVTGDGTNDVVIVNIGGSPVILPGNGNGTFDSIITLPGTGWLHTIVLGDVNGDGLMDIVTGGNSDTNVYMQRSEGGFSQYINYDVGGGDNAVGDFNSDGADDIVMPNGFSNHVSVLLGRTGGVPLEPLRFYVPGRVFVGVSVDDANSDGRADILLAGGGIAILFGDGAGGFAFGPPSLTCLGQSLTLAHSHFTLPNPVFAENSGSINDCVFKGTLGPGLTATGNVEVAHCTAEDCFNQGFSLARCIPNVLSLTALDIRGNGMFIRNGTDCIAKRNRDYGIRAYGSLNQSYADLNGEVGIWSLETVNNSTSSRNGQIGILARDVMNSKSAGNTSTAIMATNSVLGSLAMSNGSGISAPTIENCMIIGTFGSALASTGTVNDSVMLENQSVSTSTVQFNAGALADNDGEANPSVIQDMYIAGNAGGGVDGIPVSNSSIIGNHGPGIDNNISAANSNIAYNTGEGVIGGTVNNCYVFNNLLGNLVGATGSTVSSPVEDAPAFLAAVSLNRPEPVGIGGLSIDLSFSKDMNTNQHPWVTFGVQPPYTSFVMEASPGWINNRQWTSFYQISGEVTTATHTLRVSGALSQDGFSIPPDTYHHFRVDSEGGLSLNNGRVISSGTTSITISWDPSEDRHLLGYTVMRANIASGPYTLISSLPPDKTSNKDNGLSENTTYFYRVMEYDSTYNWRQLTRAIEGKTLVETNISQWRVY